MDAQVSAAQLVPFAYSWQLPEPSHLPFSPQAAALTSLHMARGSAAPAGIVVHLPSELDKEQLRQAPVQAELQQTPSTHWFDLHSLALPQGCPFCLRPQL